MKFGRAGLGSGNYLNLDSGNAAFESSTQIGVSSGFSQANGQMLSSNRP
jgi:hypothetical protein